MSLLEAAHLEQAESSEDSSCVQLGMSSTGCRKAGRSRAAQPHSWTVVIHVYMFRCFCTMPLCRKDLLCCKGSQKFPCHFLSGVLPWYTPVSVSAHPLLSPPLGWILTENAGTGPQSFSHYTSRLTTCTRTISASQHSLNTPSFKMQIWLRKNMNFALHLSLYLGCWLPEPP